MIHKRILVLVCLVASAPLAGAQPTYKLGVPPHLKPQAVLALEGHRLTRSAIKDDPGFRLQWHFLKDGKTVATLDGRALTTVASPKKEPGVYAVVLELFYPSYKPGKEQKGQFKPISNLLIYRVLPNAKPESPVQAELVPPIPGLMIHCGKGNGKAQYQTLGPGFGYKLVQGTNVDSGKSHAWSDAKEVRFEVTLPPGAWGTLRLEFVDADRKQRSQKISVQAKVREETKEFAGGKKLDVILFPDDVKTGKIEVAVQNLNPASTAVVSAVAFYPVPGGKP